MPFFKFNKKTPKTATGADASGEPVQVSTDGKAAINRWFAVLNSSPEDINAKIQIMQLAISQGDSESGNDIASRLENQHPDSVTALSLRARWHQFKNEHEPARELWTSVDKKKPGSFDVLANLAFLDLAENNLDSAWERSEQVLESASTENLHKGYVLQARIHGKRGNSEQEIESWKKVLDTTNEHFPAELNYCSGLLKMERYDELLERIDGAIAKYEDNEKFLELKCDALTKTGKAEQALELLEAGSTGDDDVQTRYQIANLLVKLERFSEAEQQCESILAIEPTHLKTLTLFARIAQLKANAA